MCSLEIGQWQPFHMKTTKIPKNKQQVLNSVMVLAAFVGLVGAQDAVKSEVKSSDTQTFSGVPLRMPRFLSKPKIYHLSPTDTVEIYRTPADTCGLYTWGIFKVSNRKGPPPHVHYADNEWFLTGAQGGVRIFLPQKPTKQLLPGQIPGMNVPPQAMGSMLIPARSAVFSTKGIVHYYVNEAGKQIEGFHNVWEPGYGMVKIFETFDQATKAGRTLSHQELLQLTGLWGVPHDNSGKMVGTRDFVKSQAAITGGVSNNLSRLQTLIDNGEKCFKD